MALDATDAIGNPGGAPGPHLVNPLRTGPYAVRDFLRPGEEKLYADTLFDLMRQLSPEGILEECFAAEIMKCTWRLHRCRAIECDFAAAAPLDPAIDPMLDEKTGKQQKTIDRARAQSHYLLRRSLSELSKLQTARTIRLQLDAEDENLGLADLKQVIAAMKMKSTLKMEQNEKPNPVPPEGDFPAGMEALAALADKQLCERYRESGLASFCNPPESPTPGGADGSVCPGRDREAERSTADPAPAPEVTKESMSRPLVSRASFCKPAVSAQAVSSKIPRNAPCPCGSGRKYKRCCGNGTLNPAPERNN
jgi:hypothetical protein